MHTHLRSTQQCTQRTNWVDFRFHSLTIDTLEIPKQIYPAFTQSSPWCLGCMPPPLSLFSLPPSLCLSQPLRVSMSLCWLKPFDSWWAWPFTLAGLTCHRASDGDGERRSEKREGYDRRMNVCAWVCVCVCVCVCQPLSSLLIPSASSHSVGCLL